MTKLTIGMAHFEDFHGVYMTLQALHLYHDLREVELLVVDNKPDGAHGLEVRNLVENWLAHSDAIGAVRYVAAPEATGTSQPRNRVFLEAASPAVLCCDCHVMFPARVIEKLIRFYDDVPGTNHLYSGPMLYDTCMDHSTHFAREWREEMWGTWAKDDRAGKPRWRIYEDLPTEDGFQIPGQGLGAFSCRKEAWLGFNPHFLGFGGEELYIHRKYELAGHAAIALPWFYWLHRFGRPDGAKYPTSTYLKVRNYVLGHLEIGMALDDIHQHFVLEKKELPDGQKVDRFTQAEWDHLVADPIRRIVGPGRGSISVPAGPIKTVDQLFEEVKMRPRDLDQHADVIRSYASKVDSIAGFVKRQEWDVFLAAGRPKKLHIYQSEKGYLRDHLHAAIDVEQKGVKAGPRWVHEYSQTLAGSDGKGDSLHVDLPEPVDMLVIDTVHHANRLYAELTRHHKNVRRFIMLRGVKQFGETAENAPGEPGLMVAMRQFVMENPQWSMLDFRPEQYGFAVFGCDNRDKPKPPPWWEMGLNFIKSQFAHLITGGGSVPEDVQKQRLSFCAVCPARRNGQCTACGCQLTAKVDQPTAFCPGGLWGPHVADSPPPKKG